MRSPRPKSGRLRRWAPRVATLLIAGAAINVLVAWACALWMPMTRRGFHASQSSSSASQLPGAVQRLGGLDHLLESWNRRDTHMLKEIGLAESSGVGVRHRRAILIMFRRLDAGGLESDTGSVTTIGAGWPLLCVEGEHHDLPLGLEPAPSAGLVGPPEPPDPWSGVVHVPERLASNVVDLPGASAAPVLPVDTLAVPFAANTLFWAGVIALPGFAWRRFRRILRLRRGLCPACAYDLKDLATCPECGTSVDAAERRSTS